MLDGCENRAGQAQAPGWAWLAEEMLLGGKPKGPAGHTLRLGGQAVSVDGSSAGHRQDTWLPVSQRRPSVPT